MSRALERRVSNLENSGGDVIDGLILALCEPTEEAQQAAWDREWAKLSPRTREAFSATMRELA